MTDLPALLPTGRILRFTLPWPLPTLNELLRANKHHRKRKRAALAWEIVALLGKDRPAAPFAFARVSITRFSMGEPDHDGLIGGAKDLLDVLQPPGEPARVGNKLVRRHPEGISVISDDSPRRMVLDMSNCRVTRRTEQKTTVTVEELGPSASPAQDEGHNMRNVASSADVTPLVSPMATHAVGRRTRAKAARA